MEAVELKKLLEEAAESGAKKALATVGLENGDARRDIIELRQHINTARVIKSTLLSTLTRMIVAGMFAALILGFLFKISEFQVQFGPAGPVSPLNGVAK